MINSNNFSKVKEESLALINCKEDFYAMKQAVDNLYEIFKLITEIDINNLNEGDILLPTGKAISPSAAAHCLLEMKRTAIFLRGIKKAIDKKVKNKIGVINILYAGCGPYATLISPLLTLYKTDRIKVTLLDINQTSLKAIENLINELDLENFVDEYIFADASDYLINRDYDIVISETMQSCLHNEPQVAIMQNLIPQMNEDSIFIPQKITIDAYLRKPGKWNDYNALREEDESKFLKEVFSVSKTCLDINNFKATIDIPEDLNGFFELMLHTTITVFEDEVLGLNNCSLNLPKKFYDFNKRYANKLEFWYSLSDKPQIECKVVDFV
jgi:predicted RNA methylase